MGVRGIFVLVLCALPALLALPSSECKKNILSQQEMSDILTRLASPFKIGKVQRISQLDLIFDGLYASLQPSTTEIKKLSAILSGLNDGVPNYGNTMKNFLKMALKFNLTEDVMNNYLKTCPDRQDPTPEAASSDDVVDTMGLELDKLEYLKEHVTCDLECKEKAIGKPKVDKYVAIKDVVDFLSSALTEMSSEGIGRYQKLRDLAKEASSKLYFDNSELEKMLENAESYMNRVQLLRRSAQAFESPSSTSRFDLMEAFQQLAC